VRKPEEAAEAAEEAEEAPEAPEALEREAKRYKILLKLTAINVVITS
jgi:hypothetical protein